jgi:hypothetical protein
MGRKERTVEKSEELDDVTFDLMEYEYGLSGNPIIVWQRILLAANEEEAIPSWCVSYLADVAEELLGREVGGSHKGEFRKVLKLDGQKKLQTSMNYDRDFKIAHKMHSLLASGAATSQEQAAVKNSYGEIGVNEDRMRQIYYEYKKNGAFDPLPEAEQKAADEAFRKWLKKRS